MMPFIKTLSLPDVCKKKIICYRFKVIRRMGEKINNQTATQTPNL